MKNIEEIQTLLGNKSFVIKNEVDFLKFVLKISPYLSFGCKRSINSFLEEREGDECYFTETLARIYIKQGRYEKALEIIKRLNLNIPKKNAYFADQIRFLDKLIINNKNKK